MISEYISDRTRAHVTGLDVADEAIGRAQERTRDKRERLSFQVGNINTLEAFPRTFDAIIAIDALHIAVELVDALRRALAALKPGGSMGIFWESWIRAGTPETSLQPDGTRLAQALEKLGLSYRPVDYSAANLALWQDSRRALGELRADFETEGNAILYQTALEETERLDWGTGCRYLYLVRARP
jgi:SAM-dependent methyltransferase